MFQVVLSLVVLLSGDTTGLGTTLLGAAMFAQMVIIGGAVGAVWLMSRTWLRWTENHLLEVAVTVTLLVLFPSRNLPWKWCYRCRRRWDGA